MSGREILTEAKFRAKFLDTLTDYQEVIQDANKCLTDNFVEIVRQAAEFNTFRWPLSSLELAGYFELARIEPSRLEEVLRDAYRHYFEHYQSDPQTQLPLENP